MTKVYYVKEIFFFFFYLISFFVTYLISLQLCCKTLLGGFGGLEKGPGYVFYLWREEGGRGSDNTVLPVNHPSCRTVV